MLEHRLQPFGSHYLLTIWVCMGLVVLPMQTAKWMGLTVILHNDCNKGVKTSTRKPFLGLAILSVVSLKSFSIRFHI